MNQALTLPGIGDLVDGRFRINRKLGEGGTSNVYEVCHVITEKRFAIKWLLPELALEDAAVDRFIHEARVGSKFDHPLAVQVFDICRANDSFYILMELLQGESLQQRLERVGRLPVHEACSIMLTCADVLSAAHRGGIIHRDLKPANIFICADGDSPEVPKLLDFGISTFCQDLQSISLTSTPHGNVIGTPLYMAPEQMLSQPVDPRADIYSIGAVLYELVSGQPPYQADSYAELVVKVTVEASAVPLDKIAPVDRQFAAVVAKAMARRPDERFQNVEELCVALRPYARQLDASSIRAISAPARPVLVSPAARLLPAPAPALSSLEADELEAADCDMSRRARWSPLRVGALAVAGVVVAAIGQHYLERSGQGLTTSQPSEAGLVMPAAPPEQAEPAADGEVDSRFDSAARLDAEEEVGLAAGPRRKPRSANSAGLVGVEPGAPTPPAHRARRQPETRQRKRGQAGERTRGRRRADDTGDTDDTARTRGGSLEQGTSPAPGSPPRVTAPAVGAGAPSPVDRLRLRRSDFAAEAARGGGGFAPPTAAVSRDDF